jgi:hypothetical protein
MKPPKKDRDVVPRIERQLNQQAEILHEEDYSETS